MFCHVVPFGVIVDVGASVSTVVVASAVSGYVSWFPAMSCALDLYSNVSPFDTVGDVSVQSFGKVIDVVPSFTVQSVHPPLFLLYCMS